MTDKSENHPLLKYKYYLHLKGIGYLCNSVICAFMAGIPIIITRENYIKNLYYQFIPEELLIFIDNYNVNQLTLSEVEVGIQSAINLSELEYRALSKKCYIHGTYFRKYYMDEIKNVQNYITRHLLL